MLGHVTSHSFSSGIVQLIHIILTYYYCTFTRLPLQCCHDDDDDGSSDVSNHPGRRNANANNPISLSSLTVVVVVVLFVQFA